jgi:hypothetical protein
MKNRLLKEGKLTSLMGALIVIAVFVMWYQQKISATEAAMIIPLSFVFFGIKDKHIGL